MTDPNVLANGAAALGVDLSPSQIAQFATYLDGLAQWNARTNLTSPAALADAVRVHVLDSLTLAPLVTREAPGAARLVDVGSGAGFPGLALKVAMPGLHVVLVEATRKKATFLEWVVRELGLEGVEVRAERAESLGHVSAYRETFDVATARAVGALPVVLELTLPLCRVGGVLLAPRGTDAAREADDAARASRELGGDTPRAEPTLSVGGVERTAVVIVRKIGPTPSRYPRRDGMPAKRPLA